MTSYHYIFQILCLATLIAVPFSLTQKEMKRTKRLALALIPVVYGLAFGVSTHETNGIFVALVGLWAMFFITIHPKKQ